MPAKHLIFARQRVELGLLVIPRLPNLPSLNMVYSRFDVTLTVIGAEGDNGMAGGCRNATENAFAVKGTYEDQALAFAPAKID